MIRVALRSLVHDRGKLVASLAGVAFAATLVLVQVGLYVGFLQGASALIGRAGGDVWVMARGTEVLDNGVALSPGSREYVARHPCARRVSGLVMAWVPMDKPRGSREVVLVIGVEPRGRGAAALPWTLVRGLPSDLDTPQRVTVDRLDLGKLQIDGDPMGAALRVGEQTVYVAGVTEGIRSFTLAPYLFTRVQTARSLAGMGDDQASYWLVETDGPRCRAELMAYVDRHPDLQARSREQFAQMTEAYWVGGSGAGAALLFAALLGLVVGVAIVGQTLYAVTKEHARELATLKALGATRGEVAGFVGWQAALLAVVGGAVGVAMALVIRRATAAAGLNLVLGGGVLAIGLGAIVFMCVVASAASLRMVLRLDAAEVFK